MVRIGAQPTQSKGPFRITNTEWPLFVMCVKSATKTILHSIGLWSSTAGKPELPISPDELAHTTDACNACAILCTSEETGANYFESHNDPTVQVKRLSKRIEALGFDVTVTERVA